MPPRKKKASTRKKATSKKSTRRTVAAEELEPSAPVQAPSDFGIQTTGRSIVTFLDHSPKGVRSAMAAMKRHVGVKTVSDARDFKTEFVMAEAETADALVFDKLGMAVMDSAPDQAAGVEALSASADANVIVEPEYVNFAFQDDLDDDLAGGDGGDLGGGGGSFEPAPSGGGGISEDYLRGLRDAIAHLLRQTGAGEAAVAVAEVGAAATFQDTASSTWGLKATRVLSSQGTGRGIRVAVLDTGFDLRHPDFAGRRVRTNSFIRGEGVQDGNGHGTHCIGTACGPEQPGRGPRYGIAFEAQIFAGKVLSNAGSGGDASILAGINWALQNRCEVISMSLGRRVRPGEPPQTNYETAGRRALRAGTLIVAAAGNDSNRPFVTVPVSSPANARTIAAVAALDRFLRVARFSNAGLNPGGGEINLAGPGVDVHSSWPMPLRLRTISGTSMATPHVAGIAALVAQENAAFRGVRLYRELRRRARRLPLPRADVGNGLVQA